MNIFITGASGFIGSNIYSFFKGKYSVTIIDRHLPFPDVSISDVLILAHAAVQSGAVVINNQELFQGNVLYTERLIQHYKRSKVIYLSTASIYCNLGVIQNNSKNNPTNSYSISKYWGENLIKNTCLNYYILRLSSVYGEGMNEGTLIPNYINQFILNDFIEVWGDGKRAQNYIHVSDIVNLIDEIILLGENKKGVYLCVDNTEYSNFEIASFIVKDNSSKIRLIGNDYSVSLNYDNKDTKNIFNWDPTVSVACGLKSYLEWKIKQS